MSKFPVEMSDDEGQVDAINYLLSGPSGLGQNFSGYSDYTFRYLTGNFRPPFSDVNNTNLTVDPISLGTSTMLDEYTWKFFFASAQPTAPFALGNPITISNVKSFDSYPKSFSLSGTKAVLGTETTYYGIAPTTLTGTGSGYIVDVTLTATGAVAYDDSNTTLNRDTRGGDYSVGDTLLILGTDLGGTSPANDLTLTITKTSGYFDGTYSPIGVVECTVDYVIVKTSGAYDIVPDGSGGTAEYNNTISVPPYPDPDGGWISTDCNAKVKVTGGTDRVFLNAQLNCELVYDSTVSSDLSYQVAINRYKGFITSDPTNPDFRFIFDKTIAFKETLYSGVTPTLSGVIPDIETLFISFIDEPEPSYYWYILEVRFIVGTGDLTIVQDTLKLRSFSAQVVKQ